MTSNELPDVPSDDPDTPADDDPTDIIVIALPDLEITKSHAEYFKDGQPGAYAIRVRNLGPGPTTGPIVVTDMLPPELTFISASGPDWTCSAAASTVTCVSNAVLLPGRERSIDLRVRAKWLGRNLVVNEVTVDTEGDDDLTNNRADDPTIVIPLAPAPALAFAGLVIALGLLMAVSARAFRRRAAANPTVSR